MTGIARTDTSLLGQWWWTVDRWSLAAIVALIGVGAIMMLAATPPVAERMGLDPFYFARRQYTLFLPAMMVMLAVSLLTPRWVRRLAVCGYLVCLLLLVLTLVIGPEIKGATRWISIAGISLQPSEFMKPCLAVVAAWMFAAQKSGQPVPGVPLSILAYGLVVGLLLLQPDVGQAIVVSAVWGVQFFLAGLPLIWVAALALLGASALLGAYVSLPHVALRIDSFLDPRVGDRYQVDRSIEAFANGGLFGRGPGEGTVKANLPDAHADFVFAVAGEELGLFACLVILALFGVVVLRGYARLINEPSLFVLLAAAGLLTQFGLQALINMGSTLHLIPTKGMTLPFISYGGSSLMALGLGIGMVLALTRRRVGRGDETCRM